MIIPYIFQKKKWKCSEGLGQSSYNENDHDSDSGVDEAHIGAYQKNKYNRK